MRKDVNYAEAVVLTGGPLGDMRKFNGCILISKETVVFNDYKFSAVRVGVFQP